MFLALERRRKFTGFWWGSPKKRDHLKDQGADGRMGSVWISGILAARVEWIQMAQGRG
jgi:hypothetical protein